MLGEFAQREADLKQAYDDRIDFADQMLKEIQDKRAEIYEAVGKSQG